jgi:hypothetical protein
VWLVRRWLPTRALVVVGDHPNAALEGLDAVRDAVGVITRWRLDAALYEPAPRRRPPQNGRPRQKGTRLATLGKVLTDAMTPWITVTMAHWYGDRPWRVQITSNTAVWSHSAKPVVPMRWGLRRDPEGRFAPQALLATTTQLRLVQSPSDFVRRWQMEVTLEEARAHLEVETPRLGSDGATARTTPAWFALYSVVTLMAAPLIGTHPMPVRGAAWSRKAHATFSDTTALGHQCLWRQCRMSTSQAEADRVQIPRILSERLTETLCYAV